MRRWLPLLMLISAPASAVERFISIVGQGPDQHIADVQSFGGVERLMVDATSSGSSVAAPMIHRVDVASAARTTSGNSDAFDTAGMGCLTYHIDITAASGASPTLQISIEVSDDGNEWTEFQNTRRYSTTAVDRRQWLPLGARYYRYAWTILGTTPSFTFSITTTLKAYMPDRHVAITKYSDLDLTAVNNLSTVFQAAGCSNVSLVTRRAADGGSGAQYRIQVSNDNFTWDDCSGDIAQNANTTVTTVLSNLAFRFYRLRVKADANPGTRVLDISWSAN